MKRLFAIVVLGLIFVGAVAGQEHLGIEGLWPNFLTDGTIIVVRQNSNGDILYGIVDGVERWYISNATTPSISVGEELLAYHSTLSEEEDLKIVSYPELDPVCSVDTGVWYEKPAWSPDVQLYYTVKNGAVMELWRMDALDDCQAELLRTKTGQTPFFPAVNGSDDIAFVSSDDMSVIVIDTKGEHLFYQSQLRVKSMSWSPNGEQLVVLEGYSPFMYRLLVTDGSLVQEIYNDTRLASPVWTTTGLYVSMWANDDYEIVKVWSNVRGD